MSALQSRADPIFDDIGQHYIGQQTIGLFERDLVLGCGVTVSQSFAVHVMYF